MSLRPIPKRLLVCYAQPDAFAPLTRVILAKMGYRIFFTEELADVPSSLSSGRPDLRLVDERRIGEVPDEEPDEAPVPIVLLSGRHGVTGADSRIVAAVRRPAGLHELYRVIQEVLEETPRSTPRVATHLPAHCRRDGREWRASLLSLSENGCLIRSPEPLALGTQLEVSFPLPKTGTVVTEAEVAYQLVPDVGLVFHSTPAQSRASIAAYVTASLNA